MKKILTLLLVVSIAVPLVLAANGTVGKPDDVGVEQPVLIAARLGDGTDNASMGENTSGPVQYRNGTLEHAGLANALAKVDNPVAVQAIERNMQRFLEQYQQRFENMNNVSIEVDEETQEVSIVGKEQVKYLGFINGQATKRFEIQNNGQITERQPWYSFLYSTAK